MSGVNTPPSPADLALLVGRVERLERRLREDGGISRLEDLDDVDIETPADADTLVYDETLAKWTNGTPAATGDPSALFAAYFITGIDANGYLRFDTLAGVNLGDIIIGSVFLGGGYSLDVVTAGVYAINFALTFKRTGAVPATAMCNFTILPAIGGDEVDQIQHHSFDSADDQHAFSFGWAGYLTPQADAIYVACPDDTDWSLQDANFNVTISRLS